MSEGPGSIETATPLVSESGMPPCPVCGSACTEPPLYRYSDARAAAHFCPPARDAERFSRLVRCIRRLWRGNECVILRCRECTFSFASPLVGGDEEFYDILHEQQGYPSWRWDYDVAVAEAAPRGSGGRIIDIGAGSGTFLVALDDAWEKYATEGGESTRAQLESTGIRVSRDLAELVSRESGTFDVVTMFQLLEHIAEFRPLLVQCRALLRPGGKLVITVPHGEAMIRQERLTGCPDMPPFHVNKWTPRSLSRALQQVGFSHAAPIPSAAQWSNVSRAMHLRVMTDSGQPGSVASKVYRIKRRAMRIPLLALLGIPALARMLPDIGELRLGGAFAIVATPA
jgi:SAM-dependent methyltransferase